MDQLTVLPAATEAVATTEPAAHIAHAANPTPSHGPNHNHPPYAEMITAAITALKDKKGSSRRAIAKYIDKEYSNLPATHSALLTHHLKRLKTNGLLVMVKHSYKLPPTPRSVPFSPPPPPPHANGNTTANPSFPGLKRGPGRPPKPKPDFQPNPAVPGPESLFLSLGLVDDGPRAQAPLKRGRGRPPKVITGSVAAPPTLPKPKRSSGRPPRPKSLSVLMGQSGPKKGSGRPPKTAPMSVFGSGGNVARPRGRPKKDTVKPAGRPRGRPPKNVAVNGGALVPIDGGGGGLLPARPPGRRPKVGVAKKPRKLTGRPLGRPKKSALVTAIQVSDPQQLMAYQDLKTKLEHLQSRVKLAVSVVKPCLNNDNGTVVSALGALQELEELATIDVCAPLIPLNVQVQEPLLQN